MNHFSTKHKSILFLDGKVSKIFRQESGDLLICGDLNHVSMDVVGKEVDLMVEFYRNFISGYFNFWSNGKTRSSEWLEKVVLKMIKKEASNNKILPRDWESKSTLEIMVTNALVRPRIT